MLAKCSRCSQTFQTDRYGEQFCPFCGAAVMIAAAPGAGAQPATGAQPSSDPGGPEQPAPVDTPEAFGGWFKAALETWTKTITDPVNFFNRVKAGPDAGGAVGYAMAILGIGGIFAGLIQYVQGLVQRGQFEQLQQQMQQMPPEMQNIMTAVLKLAQPSLTQVLVTPVAAVVGFFFGAAILHLSLMIVGGNKAGFTGTLRGLAFAQAPYLFSVVPMCGALAAWGWTLVLTVMALSGVHKISIGRAIGAYAVMVFGVCCLCITPVAGLIGWAVAQAAQHGSSALHVP